MLKNTGIKSVVILSQSGCILPLLILLNLFFGWMFLKPLYWIGTEAALILLFFLNAVILSRSISDFSKKNSRVIDVDAEILEEKPRLE